MIFFYGFFSFGFLSGNRAADPRGLGSWRGSGGGGGPGSSRASKSGVFPRNRALDTLRRVTIMKLRIILNSASGRMPRERFSDARPGRASRRL